MPERFCCCAHRLRVRCVQRMVLTLVAHLQRWLALLQRSYDPNVKALVNAFVANPSAIDAYRGDKVRDSSCVGLCRSATQRSRSLTVLRVRALTHCLWVQAIEVLVSEAPPPWYEERDAPNWSDAVEQLQSISESPRFNKRK